MALSQKDEGYARAVIKFYEQKYLSLFNKGVLGNEDMKQLLKISNFVDKQMSHEWVLITINFTDDPECEPIYAEVNKVLSSRKWLMNYVYTWEFYDKDGEWSHPHVHLLAKYTKYKSQIIRELAKTLDIDTNFIDVRLVKTGKYDKVLTYITKNRHLDVTTRKEKNLDQKYSDDNTILEKLENEKY